MKVITAIIKPFMLDKLSRMLVKAPITGFTTCDARGYGRGGEGSDLLNPRVRVEIVLLDDDVAAVSDLIMRTVSTHQEGDGIMFVTSVDSVTNIRTGAVGREALLIT